MIPRRPLAPPALAAVAGASLGASLSLPWLSLATGAAVVATIWPARRRRPHPLATAAALLAVACLVGARAQRASVPPQAALQGPCQLAGVIEAPASPTAYRGYRAVLRQGDHRLELLLRQPPPLGPVRVLGRGRALDPDRRRWLARRGLSGSVTATVVTLTGPPRPLGLVDGVKAHVRALIRRAVRPRLRPLFAAVVTGDPPALDPKLRDAFRRSGAAHLLSLSGLHVGLLAGLALALSRLAGVPAAHRAWVITAALLVYLLVAGPRIPTLRATVAGCACFLAPHRGDAWNRLAGAALLILGLDPLAIGDVGLQLSFGTVAGILALARPLREALPRSASANLTASLAAFCSATPLLGLTLGQLPLASLVIGVPAVSAFTAALALALLGAALGALLPDLGVALLSLADLAAAALVALVEWSASWGWDLALTRPASPALGVLGVGLLVLGAARRERGARHAVWCVAGALGLLVAILSGDPSPLL